MFLRTSSSSSSTGSGEQQRTFSGGSNLSSKLNLQGPANDDVRISSSKDYVDYVRRLVGGGSHHLAADFGRMAASPRTYSRPSSEGSVGDSVEGSSGSADWVGGVGCFLFLFFLVFYLFVLFCFSWVYLLWVFGSREL